MGHSQHKDKHKRRRNQKRLEGQDRAEESGSSDKHPLQLGEEKEKMVFRCKPGSPGACCHKVSQEMEKLS